MPEVACVGKTQKDCIKPKTAIFDLKWNAKSQLSGHEEGFVKVIMENGIIYLMKILMLILLICIKYLWKKQLELKGHIIINLKYISTDFL